MRHDKKPHETREIFEDFVQRLQNLCDNLYVALLYAEKDKNDPEKVQLTLVRLQQEDFHRLPTK